MFIDPVHTETPTRIQICNYSFDTHTLVVTVPLPPPTLSLFQEIHRKLGGVNLE
jgi:hypothetical protein